MPHIAAELVFFFFFFNLGNKVGVRIEQCADFINQRDLSLQDSALIIEH